MIRPAFLTLLKQTLQQAVLDSRDDYGNPTFGFGVSYPCRVVARLTRVRSFSGEEVVARTVAWVASTSRFGPEDEYTLPDGTMPPLLSVETFPDETGTIHHQKLFFG